ncbi:MAG: prephenate dehydrogenase [Methanobrevibacter millerae]|uniref:Prephenate dehydrogenase n=1 Tax=Methanobrevibacter millerae TaxID=230361 RepID=A0A8T3VJ29_9EURY|nr:prephenate dehydrogenase [Methanobrevibacter millerae]
MKIGIIGGSDGLGKTLIYYFRDEFKVSISARDHDKGRKVAEEMNVDYVESNKKLAAMSNILIISVPIHHTPSVIREVAPFMKKGSVMIDVTSVKEKPLKTMEECLPDNVEFIPTHPVFGPRTTELDNQVIVLTATKKGKWYEKVYDYLDSKNMRIIETTAHHHDYMMSIVQVLTHFSFISTASAMEKLKVDITETEDYESPIYNLMIDMIARIVSQNPYLTYYIQTMNSNGTQIRNAFSEAVTELRDVIEAKNDEKFVEIAINATKNMGDIQNALGRSDKAINGLNHEFNILKKSIGHEIALEHIYSGKVHIGVLEKIDGKSAILDNGTKLRIANIRVLNDEELYQWRLENTKQKEESISCMFPDSVTPNIIVETIENIQDITEVILTDIYKGPQIAEGYESLTFNVKALNKDAINNVKKVLTGFGGVLR